VPNGTNNIKVDAQNLTKISSNVTSSYVNIYALSTVPVTVTFTGNTTELQKTYNSSIISMKTINLINETSPKTISYTFNDTNIKGFLIVNINAKGTIQIFTS
jgi:BarA-like signal transduction histidine kinase